MGYSCRNCLPWIIVLLLFPLPRVGISGADPAVRVLLCEKAGDVLVQGDQLTVEVESGGGWIERADCLRKAAFSDSAGTVLLQDPQYRGRLFRVSSRNNVMTVDGTRHRGFLLICRDSSGLRSVLTIPLESYLAGLVNGEINSSWPAEAVKAQVVAARTYALYRMENRNYLDFDIRDDESDQVYLGVAGEDKRSIDAVLATRGLALYQNGKLIPAFYHSSCGGYTGNAGEIWGLYHPSLVETECSHCIDSPDHHWKLVLRLAEVEEALRALFPGEGEFRSLSIGKRTEGGRAKVLSMETSERTILLDAGDFRREIGYSRLKSTMFTMKTDGEFLSFMGKGYGHGIGLCQWGAKGAAQQGWDYARILKKYYRGAVVLKAY